MTIEQLLAEARSKGLYLSNLFEKQTAHNDLIGNGVWKASFRHIGGWRDFGAGNSPEAALKDALERCRGAKGPDNRPFVEPASSPIAEEEFSIL